MDSTRFGENGMNKLAKINGGDSESAIKSAGGIARPSSEQVEQAVSTLIRMVGRRSRARGLVATPARVVRADEEWFSGYDEDQELLQRTFEEVAG
jgi:GTP cyclohydrolase IA